VLIVELLSGVWLVATCSINVEDRNDLEIRSIPKTVLVGQFFIHITNLILGIIASPFSNPPYIGPHFAVGVFALVYMGRARPP